LSARRENLRALRDKYHLYLFFAGIVTRGDIEDVGEPLYWRAVLLRLRKKRRSGCCVSRKICTTRDLADKAINALAGRFGGRVLGYKKSGTADWKLPFLGPYVSWGKLIWRLTLRRFLFGWRRR